MFHTVGNLRVAVEETEERERLGMENERWNRERRCGRRRGRIQVGQVERLW